MAYCAISSNGRYILDSSGAAIVNPSFQQWDASEYSSAWPCEVADPTTFKEVLNSARYWTLEDFLGQTDSWAGILVPNSHGWITFSGSTANLDASFSTNMGKILDLCITHDKYIIFSYNWMQIFDENWWSSNPWQTAQGGPYSTITDLYNGGYPNPDVYYQNAMKAVFNALAAMSTARKERILGVIVNGEGVTIKYKCGGAYNFDQAFDWWLRQHQLFYDLKASEGWPSWLSIGHWGRDIFEHLDAADINTFATTPYIDIVGIENYEIGDKYMHNTPTGLWDLVANNARNSFNETSKPILNTEAVALGWHGRHYLGPHDPTNWDGTYSGLETDHHTCINLLGAGVDAGSGLLCHKGQDANGTGNGACMWNGDFIGWDENCPEGTKRAITIDEAKAIVRAMMLPALFEGACCFNQWAPWATSGITDWGEHRQNLNAVTEDVFQTLIGSDGLASTVTNIRNDVIIIDGHGNAWQKSAIKFGSDTNAKYLVYLLRDHVVNLQADDYLVDFSVAVDLNGNYTYRRYYPHFETLGSWQAGVATNGYLYIEGLVDFNDVIYEIVPASGEDVTSPGLSEFLPQPDAIDVNPETNIEVTVSDTGSGVAVALTTLEIDGGGEIAYDDANMTVTEISSGYIYRYSYDPASPLGSGIHYVNWYAEDNDGNSVGMGYYFFVGEEEPQLPTPTNFFIFSAVWDEIEGTGLIGLKWDEIIPNDLIDGFILLYSFGGPPEEYPPNYDPGAPMEQDDIWANCTVHIFGNDRTGCTIEVAAPGWHYFALGTYKEDA